MKVSNCIKPTLTYMHCRPGLQHLLSAPYEQDTPYRKTHDPRDS